LDSKSGPARVIEKPRKNAKAREQALDENSLEDSSNQNAKIKFENCRFHHA